MKDKSITFMSGWPQMVIMMDYKNDTALENILDKCADKCADFNGSNVSQVNQSSWSSVLGVIFPICDYGLYCSTAAYRLDLYYFNNPYIQNGYLLIW